MPEQLGFAYRRSGLAPGEVVARASLRARGRPRRGGQARPWPTCAAGAGRPSPRASRPSARPSRTPPTRGPRAAAPASCWRRPAAAGCGSGAPASPTSTPTSWRTTATPPPPTWWRVMAEGRRRVKERFGVELEPEVQSLGPVHVPARVGAGRDRQRPPRARAGAASRPRPRRRAGAAGAGGAGLPRARAADAGCASLALLLVLGGGCLWLRDSSLVAVQRVRVVGVSGPDAGADPLRPGRPRRAT